MSDASGTAIRVPRGLHLQSRLFAATAGLWRRLGDLETSTVRDEIAGIQVNKPVYVTSLARAGTTIVTEMLERHPALTSHRYSDFPNVWTPYWRNYLLQRSRRETPEVRERAHKDRIRVSNDSPEAVEELLWMHFFPQWRDNTSSQVMDGHSRDPDFDRFYLEHIRKLLAVRHCSRYLAKGNYNIARLKYLLSLFPDARFLVPVRDPVHHIASLMKQHRLFLAAHAEDPRVTRQLAMSGHFEFGARRTFVNFGDGEAAASIRSCWEQGREVEGWARCWAATYQNLLRQLRDDAGLRAAVFLFRYEDLCRRSRQVIDAMLQHCELEQESFVPVKEEYSQRLSLPDYYRPQLRREQLDAIQARCGSILEQVNIIACRPV